MIRNEGGWISEYQRKNALWIHDRNPKRPHALLTSGKHSSGFFNSELVMEDPLLLDEACSDLAEMVAEKLSSCDIIDRSVGPAMGAITLANDLARHIAKRQIKGVNITNCLRAYTEKEGEGDLRMMAFKRTKIKKGERILLCEDVLTTGKIIDLVIDAVLKSGGILLPVVAALVNRSGLTEMNGKKIIALINRSMPMWMPEECPLCKAGSEAIRPKGPPEWARLNATY